MTKCPKCGAEPFDPFLPGQVVRFAWFGLRRDVYAVICAACKAIVGYERLATAMIAQRVEFRRWYGGMAGAEKGPDRRG